MKRKQIKNGDHTKKMIEENKKMDKQKGLKKKFKNKKK